MHAHTEKIKIDYNGKQVTARKLTVVSKIPINIDRAWSKVQTSALLHFVTAPKLKFKPHFPEKWKEADGRKCYFCKVIEVMCRRRPGVSKPKPTPDINVLFIDDDLKSLWIFAV